MVAPWCAGRSVAINSVANADVNTYFPFLAETECNVERVLRVWWDELGGYAAGDRDVAYLRVTFGGEGVAEQDYRYEAPCQGLAVRVPPGRARIDVRFNNTGAAIGAQARVYGRIDPGRISAREVITRGLVDATTPAINREYDPHSDPGARFAQYLKVQTYGQGVADTVAFSQGVFAGTLPPNVQYLIDARGKITLTPGANAAFHAWWCIWE